MSDKALQIVADGQNSTVERASMFQGIYEGIWSTLRQGGVY